MFLSNTIKTLLVATAVLAAPSALAAPTENLIGETLITSSNVYSYANSAYTETQRILSSKQWTTSSNTDGILNEAKPISGVFAASNVTLTRASAIVNVPAQKLFNYLITAEGYKLIDPFSTPEDFSKPPLQSFSTVGWRGLSSTGKRLEVARTSSVIEGIREREFVVLNAIDSNSRTFVSKSVQHKGDAGCSAYGPSSCYSAAAIPVRAINTFAVQVNAVSGNSSRCQVQLVNYVDLMGPEIPAVAQNGINAGFLPAMVGRMRAAFP